MGYEASSMSPKRDKYFANYDRENIADQLLKKVDEYHTTLLRTGRLMTWRRSYDYYYKSLMRGGRVIKTGQNNEYITINVNHFRNLLNHRLVMTTSQRPSFEPRASNTDYKSQAQTLVASNVLDYYNREKRMDENLKQSVETALIFGQAELSLEWDPTAGPDYGQDPETKRMIKQGDVVLENFTPLDVIGDVTLTSPEQSIWKITRSYKNAWDLAAKFPQYADDILQQSIDMKTLQQRRFGTPWYVTSDLVPVYKFYHAKTDAVPNGRFVQFVSDKSVMVDSGLPYKRLPVHSIFPSQQKGTPFGYSEAFDLLPLQEILDTLYSIVTTNQLTFGVQNIAMPAGSNVSVKQLVEGMNLLEYNAKAGGKPEGMSLVSTKPEIFTFMEMIERTMETISGVNSVSRGNPEASLKSGAALALVQSMAIQFASGLQQSYAQLLEATGTSLISILQDFASTPRMITVAGKSNSSYMVQFSGKDLANIDRVTVDMGNPLARTTAGKVDIANTLLEAQMVDTPDQYLQVLTTGRLEPLLEGKQAELTLIRAENEAISKGESVQAVITDNHVLHIFEHKVTLANPISRKDPKVVKACTDHLQEHIELLRTADPQLLQILGQTPLQPPAPTNVPHGTNPAMPAENPVVQEASKVNMPSMPTNALNGKTFNPVTGGL